MGTLSHYTFRSVWNIPAAPEDCYAVLYELARYPEWWPEVKEAQRLSDSSFSLRCRSVLPYDLEFITSRAVEDHDAKILEAKMEGDLEGFSRWTITATERGSRCTFDEVVITNKALLNRIAFAARPFFKANHTLMMRHGRAGLRTFVAGYRLGAGSTPA